MKHLLAIFSFTQRVDNFYLDINSNFLNQPCISRHHSSRIFFIAQQNKSYASKQYILNSGTVYNHFPKIFILHCSLNSKYNATLLHRINSFHPPIRTQARPRTHSYVPVAISQHLRNVYKLIESWGALLWSGKVIALDRAWNLAGASSNEKRI